MSLRTRLFLLVGGLAAVLVVAQWWLVRSLSRDVSSEVGDVAFRVGEGVVASLGMVERSPHPGSGPAPDPRALARRFELPAAAPAAPGARSVVEREIVIREIDGELRVASQRVKVGATDGSIVSTDQIVGEGDPLTERFVTLSVDTAHDAGFLKVHGPAMERRVPIPRGGLEDALDAFRRRLLAGSAALLLCGILVAAAIAHRATAPLRELRDAARAVGDGALGTQVPLPAGARAGEVGGAVAAFNRMSARLAELDADARRLREREHLTEVGEIARGLAHGLRNPLNALGLTVDELAQGPSESARAPLADAARRQIRRIDQSVRSFLALSASATKAPDEDVDVGALVQDVALEALQDARGRVGVSVEAPDETLRVRGVPAELRAVVQALVVNAVEASPDGARVKASVERGDEARVRVVIDDDGPGIADGVRARLFTPHVTTKPSGSGMGLYLAHRIVAARGGRLGLEAREPHGTRAVVELPS